MTLKDLKTEIEYKKPIEELVIFTYSDSDFIAHQYIREISNYMDSDIILLESLNDFNGDSSFFVDTSIYIYKCDKLEIKTNKYKTAKNLFIVCKSIEKETEKLYSKYIIDLPKLKDWQIIDLINFKCPTVAKQFEPYVGKMDIYNLINEIDKVSIFSKNKAEIETASFDEKCVPENIIKMIDADGGWNYLPKFTIFDLVQALILRDAKTVNAILNTQMEIPVVLLCQLLYNQIVDIIHIVIDPTSNADSLGIKSGKYWAIKNIYKHIDKDKLTKQFQFILSIDKLVKTGKISYDEKLLDRIIIYFLR